MKFVAASVLGLSLVLANPAASAAAVPAPHAAAPTPAHVKAVQDLLATMQVEKVLRSVAARSRYASEAQRQAVFARIGQTPPAEVARRLAPALAPSISADTAAEMTRFYQTPYGKRVLHEKYNSSAQIQMPGMKPVVPPEEKKERKRAAYVKASKELADAAPLIEREAFKLLQKILAEKR
ncbi:hypothetical protein LE190_18340 [Massilia oculi]|uniref:DUF2059 domain-containing protein n=1 Tax=Massilia hydrophila TaxID=3044279 RepID=A0ABS7YDS7_9BURK|nr:hypothetical protein [Massilia oculi]MCA1857867.1 hypothetical protein [Massilia oculi]